MAWAFSDIATSRKEVRLAREQGAKKLAAERERMKNLRSAGEKEVGSGERAGGRSKRNPFAAKRPMKGRAWASKEETAGNALAVAGEEALRAWLARVHAESVSREGTRVENTLGSEAIVESVSREGVSVENTLGSGVIAGSVSREGAGVLAETVLRERRKISVDDVSCLRVGTSPRQRQLLQNLFEGIVLPSDKVFEGGLRAREVWNALNKKFKREYGADAVLLKTLDGERPKAGKFYWLGLNPELFEVEEWKPLPGVHYKLEDVFRPAQALIIEHVAAHAYSSVEMIAKATGLKLETVCTYVFSAINRQCKAVGLREAIESVEANPTLYCVNNEIASLFDLELGNGISLEIFSETERKLVRFLAENPKSTRKQVGEFLECSPHKVALLVENVDRKADLLGYRAIASYTSGMTRTNHLSLTQRFAEAVGLRVKEKHELSNYFTPKEIEAIMFLKGKPGAVMRELNEALGTRNSSTHQKIKAVERKCARHELPVPFTVESRVHGGKYSLSREFEELFFGKEGKVEASETKVAANGAPKVSTAQVYTYFTERRNATVADAAREFGVSEQVIREKVEALNGMLLAHGFGSANGRVFTTG